jgi:hypothetical protein
MQSVATAVQMRFGFNDRETEESETTSTFIDNLSLPIHRWFRYSAGFSALWVRDLIEREKGRGRRRILDPFVGSGTVLLESELCNVEGIGLETHPFVIRVAKTKLYWREDPKTFRSYSLSILEQAKQAKSEKSSADQYPKLIQKCFPPEILSRLNSLHRAWEGRTDGSPAAELSWLALVSILRDCSSAGTAQWQYILPRKTKAKTLDPYKAFEAKIYLMSDDMAKRQRQIHGPKAILQSADARDCFFVPDGWADLVITSPPYANNYDYADATRLEMSFLGEVQGWGDLQEAVRKYLIRSCTQHVATLNGQVSAILDTPLLDPIRKEITKTCEHLGEEREKHGGRKPYNAMIAAYFSDMAKVWAALRRVTSKDSLVCFVIGDSAPYGVHVPVDRWFGELALSSGFKSYVFEKTRDRNIKWKNRKHRVPLHEGRLWIQG